MRNFNFVAVAILGTIGSYLVGGMSSAHAANLIPQSEGEIKTNLGCLTSSCIDTQQELGYTVTSLDYTDSTGQTKYKASRLFSDNRTTANTYGSEINFKMVDEGTNSKTTNFWLRPVAVDEQGNAVEDGRLEVGRFKFDFGKVFSQVQLSLFDVEDTLRTGILEINGKSIKELLTSAGTPDDGSTKFLTLKDVSSFVVQIGYRGADSIWGEKTGDGVYLSGAKTVPEPGSIVGLGALGMVAMFGLRQRKKVSKLAS
ncbi:MAG: LEVG family PEP-CTERM protein [Cyanomargarita calcarea GSE-NOS-MK-12-04C]|uniref:LEVG family PEP-CTERM protein n=1 Tax=Cyanomargarita calcarea GSE-NOS-MK-12-04C TaxID=2839659 RepID=A0A951QJB7_9CYAN|nr:LEVG family PEP-CTERM protein [Cyanomargarita calcarea GSE-NOS-MK-12-04C]